MSTSIQPVYQDNYIGLRLTLFLNQVCYGLSLEYRLDSVSSS